MRADGVKAIASKTRRGGFSTSRTPALVFAGALALLSLTISPQTAVAHGVSLSAAPREGIEVLAVYDGGEPMAGAQVAVFAPGEPDEPWLLGATDEHGRFFFTPDTDRPGTWEAHIRQAGHGGIVQIEVGPTRSAIPTEVADSVEPTPAEAPEEARTQSGSTHAPQPAGNRLTALQKALMAASVAWGAIGTALYFLRRTT